MLDGNDTGTFHALRLLRDLASERRKPLVIWAGAGVSMWCGFPNWEETAHRMQSSFRKYERRYRREDGKRLVEEGKLPELFSLLQKTNQQLYNRELAALFVSRHPTPVYRRFLSIAEAIAPLQILTTNVDDMLERNLPDAAAIQTSDLERCIELISGSTSFVAKLHGSVSSIRSTVFSTGDYQRLLQDPGFLVSLQTIISQSVVLFIGYSLRDKYVLDLLQRNLTSKPVFGDGPHFLVSAEESQFVPENVHVIRYIPEPFADHRSAITVLDIVRVTRSSGAEWFAPANPEPEAQAELESSYFIADIVPPGTWTTSQSLVLGGRVGLTPNAIVGQGFDNSELPQMTSPAMHDLIVGLTSFDRIRVPLSCAALLHDLLGSGLFWDLVKADVFRFIYFEQQPIMIFRGTDVVDGGDIATFHVSPEEGKTLTIQDQIRKQFRAAQGREDEVEGLLKLLEEKTSAFDHLRFNIPSMTRGALLHPSVQRLLGISDGIFPNSIPRWLMFPVIRLAHVIMAGCTCEHFHLPAAKLGFGSEVLIGAAFASSAARDWAENVSSYVLTGQFNGDLGAYAEANPEIWRTILKFRDTQDAVNLRREILQGLATSEGGEFTAAVNAGLRHIVPSSVMEDARAQVNGLLFRREGGSRVVPAVWTNLRNSDAIACLWRSRSKRELETQCKAYGIAPKNLCPCKSGEKLRDCCGKTLGLT